MDSRYSHGTVLNMSALCCCSCVPVVDPGPEPVFTKIPTCEHAPTITVISVMQADDHDEFTLIVESDDYLPLPVGWTYSLEQDHQAFSERFPIVRHAVTTSTYKAHADRSLYHVATLVSSSSSGVEPTPFPRPDANDLQEQV